MTDNHIIMLKINDVNLQIIYIEYKQLNRISSVNAFMFHD